MMVVLTMVAMMRTPLVLPELILQLMLQLICSALTLILRIEIESTRIYLRRDYVLVLSFLWMEPLSVCFPIVVVLLPERRHYIRFWLIAPLSVAVISFMFVFMMWMILMIFSLWHLL